jgi:hypothetical protein
MVIVSSDYLLKQLLVVDVCNGEVLYSLWGMKWFIKEAWYLMGFGLIELITTLNYINADAELFHLRCWFTSGSFFL